MIFFSRIICLMAMLPCLLLAKLDYREEANYLEKCSHCELDKCSKLGQCSLGMVKDRCGCCDICGLEEFQLCTLNEDLVPFSMGLKRGYFHGRCGDGLECRLRMDIDPQLMQRGQSICYCKKEGVVCGSDGHTYSHCELQARITSSYGAVHKVNDGPCKSEPTILSISPAKTTPEGMPVTFSCEVQGFPIPTVSWFFSKPGKPHESTRLPGDSQEISVSLRGGPLITRLTSHLQITQSEVKHEGVYKCIAENDLGMKSQSVIFTVDSNHAPTYGHKWASDDL